MQHYHLQQDRPAKVGCAADAASGHCCPRLAALEATKPGRVRTCIVASMCTLLDISIITVPACSSGCVRAMTKAQRQVREDLVCSCFCLMLGGNGSKRHASRTYMAAAPLTVYLIAMTLSGTDKAACDEAASPHRQHRVGLCWQSHCAVGLDIKINAHLESPNT